MILAEDTVVAGLPQDFLDRGNRLMAQGALAEAVVAYRALTVTAPQFGPGYRNLALALERQGQFDEALAVCGRGVEVQPDDIESYLVMASLLLRLERTDAAVSMYQLAVMVAPGRSEIHANLAAGLTRQGHLAEARAACEKALALDPHDVGAHINLGIVLSKQDDSDGAIAAYRRAIALDPQSAAGHANLAIAYSAAGLIAPAVAASRCAVALRPDDPELRYNHATLLLLAGDLAEGFAEFEIRLSHPAQRFKLRTFDAPRWNGEPRHGRTLMIHAEQGLGDTLQFARFVAAAAATGGPVVVQVQPPLVDLLRDNLDATVVSRDDAVPAYDLQIPMMSLPHALGTGIDSIPGRPYLAASAAKASEWRARLAGNANLKVGVAWAGSPGHLQDRKRSLSAEVLLPRLLMPGVQLFSLQKEPGAGDRAVLERLGSQVVDLAPFLTSFADTAAAASDMDLVISVDTSVAHLAGAIGRPTWILLPHVLDWRWLSARADTPWYPTARLFRQPQPMDWASVLDRLPGALQGFAADLRLDGAVAAPPQRLSA